MMCWHKWTRWVEYVRVFAEQRGLRDVKLTQIWQRRECEKCGKAQRAPVVTACGHPLGPA